MNYADTMDFLNNPALDQQVPKSKPMPWDDFDWKDPLSYLSTGLGTLGLPGDYTRGLLAGRPGERLSGEELGNAWGALDPKSHSIGHTLGGIGLGLVTDPLNVVPALGLGLKGLGALRGASVGEEAANVGRAALRPPYVPTGLPTAEEDAQAAQWIKPTAMAPYKAPSEGVMPVGRPPLEQMAPAMPQQIMPIPLPAPQYAPPFYSRLQQAAQGLPENVKAQSLTNLLKKAPGGISQEELGYTFPKGLLPEKGVVPKQDVLDAIERNGIKVERKMLGGDQDAQTRLFDQLNRQYFETPRAERDAPGAIGDRMMAAYDALHSTQYNDYATPGGENYKEMLLKLPLGVKSTPKVQQEIATPENRTRLVAALQKSRPAIEYNSEHWPDDPNVIAHVRMDDRAGPNGEKVLHVQEVQSDWHQAGREAGYKTPDTPTESEAYKAYSAMMRDPNATKEQTDVAARAVDTARLRDAKGVPDAPFKNNEWANLALKHVVDYAQKNGYDAISFNNGALAKRYAAGGGGDIKGLTDWYERQLPQRMQKLFGLKNEPHEIEIPKPDRGMLGGGDFDIDLNTGAFVPLPTAGTEKHTIPFFRLSNDLKNRIANKGQPLLSAPWLIPALAGAGGAAAATQQQEQ